MKCLEHFDIPHKSIAKAVLWKVTCMIHMRIHDSFMRRTCTARPNAQWGLTNVISPLSVRSNEHNSLISALFTHLSPCGYLSLPYPLLTLLPLPCTAQPARWIQDLPVPSHMIFPQHHPLSATLGWLHV